MEHTPICLPLFYRFLPNAMPKTIYDMDLDDVVWFVMNDRDRFVDDIFVELCEYYHSDHVTDNTIALDAIYQEMYDCRAWSDDVYHWFIQLGVFAPKYLGMEGILRLRVLADINLLVAIPTEIPQEKELLV